MTKKEIKHLLRPTILSGTMISSLKTPSFENPITPGNCGLCWAPPGGPDPGNSPPVLATFLVSGSRKKKTNLNYYSNLICVLLI